LIGVCGQTIDGKFYSTQKRRFTVHSPKTERPGAFNASKRSQKTAEIETFLALLHKTKPNPRTMNPGITPAPQEPSRKKLVQSQAVFSNILSRCGIPSPPSGLRRDHGLPEQAPYSSQ
jgi:hypothetical protein